MSTEVKKGEKFIKEVVSRLTGDDKEALASKIARKSVTAVQGQISALEAKEIDLENILEDKQDALSSAMYPTVLPANNFDYVSGISYSQSDFDDAQEDLDAVKDSIEFFKGLLAKF